MGRKKSNRIKCKKCGARFQSVSEVKIIKMWHVVAPFPDKEGNITINVMASWMCPKCGYKNRGKIASLKSGEVLAKGGSYTDRLVKIITERKEISISELAKKFNTSPQTIKKALEYLIKKNLLQAKIEGDIVIAL